MTVADRRRYVALARFGGAKEEQQEDEMDEVCRVRVGYGTLIEKKTRNENEPERRRSIQPAARGERGRNEGGVNVVEEEQ